MVQLLMAARVWRLRGIELKCGEAVEAGQVSWTLRRTAGLQRVLTAQGVVSTGDSRPLPAGGDRLENFLFEVR